MCFARLDLTRDVQTSEKQTMSERRTHASVTDVDCSCDYLQRAADDPDVPIQFEASTGEYQFTYQAEVWGPSMLVIYHCPFCGGAAPKSKRAQLFHAISDAEEERLKELLHPIKTIEDVLQSFGAPDSDKPLASSSTDNEVDDEPARTDYWRLLEYRSLSETVDVSVLEGAGGRVSFSMSGKRKAAGHRD